MKLSLRYQVRPPGHFLAGIQEALAGVWAESANDYAAKYWAAEAAKKAPPKGVQAQINQVIEKKLRIEGWEGTDGRFVRNNTFLRVTFRHQMSLGSDFMDALMLAQREGIECAVIAAAALDFAKKITPRDFNSIVTFEKLVPYYTRVLPLFPIPLAIGELTPASVLAPDVERLINQRR
jgi:hypothetical protein